MVTLSDDDAGLIADILEEEIATFDGDNFPALAVSLQRIVKQIRQEVSDEL